MENALIVRKLLDGMDVRVAAVQEFPNPNNYWERTHGVKVMANQKDVRPVLVKLLRVNFPVKLEIIGE